MTREELDHVGPGYYELGIPKPPETPRCEANGTPYCVFGHSPRVPRVDHELWHTKDAVERAQVTPSIPLCC